MKSILMNGASRVSPAMIACMLILIPMQTTFAFAAGSVYDRIYDETKPRGTVKEISYDKFMKIRGSGESFALLDVLSADSFGEGHIPGSISFPENDINELTASKLLPKDARIIVYCANFLCSASTSAAKKLAGLGYKVVDYKGGLEDWKKKGNALVK